jgi:hypothetical protein
MHIEKPNTCIYIGLVTVESVALKIESQGTSDKPSALPPKAKYCDQLSSALLSPSMGDTSLGLDWIRLRCQL